jgi:Zn finger protein HypA/HybF involved in hydrogenase expression
MKKVIVSLLVLAFVALAATGTVSAQCAAKTTTTSVATTCAQCTSCQKTSTCPRATCTSYPMTTWKYSAYATVKHAVACPTCRLA